MSITEYEKAKRIGERAFRRDMLRGRYPYLPVLDDIIQKEEIIGETNLGLVNIPLDRVIGTSTAGRTNAFARNFMPIMDMNTEFGVKWAMLCDAHIAEGIHDAIKVYEFMNYFYVVEGNKRVSVLKYFNADSIPAFVTRKIPKLSDRKDIKIYYEFMDLNLRNYAHLGDALWDVFVREKIIYKTQNSKTMHKLTIEKVNGEFQVELLKFLEPYLTDEEKDLVRRARNIPTSAFRKISHAVHSGATAFEVLIGFNYINNKPRLNEIYELLNDKI